LGREGGKICGHHHRRDVPGVDDFASGVDAQPLQHGLQRLAGERRIAQRVSRAVEADHDAVADQDIAPDPFDLRQVLDA
jgi:hypothetical protein